MMNTLKVEDFRELVIMFDKLAIMGNHQRLAWFSSMSLVFDTAYLNEHCNWKMPAMPTSYIGYNRNRKRNREESISIASTV